MGSEIAPHAAFTITVTITIIIVTITTTITNTHIHTIKTWLVLRKLTRTTAVMARMVDFANQTTGLRVP